MAETEKTIIEFDFDYGDAVKQTEILTDKLLGLRKQVADNKQAQKDLKKAGGDNVQGLKDLQKAELVLKDKLSDANRERKKAVDITKIQAHTLEGLRKQTKAMFAEREKLDTSIVKNSKRFTELTKKIKQNNDVIKKADQSAGSYTSSIGNYSNALSGVSPRMGGFITQLKTAKDGLISAKAGLVANITSLGVFKIALISTGMGALLVALGSLITFFTKTQRGMDKISKAMEFLGGFVAELVDRLAGFGESLANAISEPQKLWEGFLDFLKNQFQTRLEGLLGTFSGLGEVIEGLFSFDWDQMKEGVSNTGEALVKLGTGFSSEEIVDGFNNVTTAIIEMGSQALKEANAMSALEDQAQALRDAQIKFIVESAKVRRQIAELRLASKDANKTDEERLAILQEAIALENHLLDSKLKLVTEEARISQLRTDMGESTAEELRANAELQAAVDDTFSASAKAKLRLQSEIFSLTRVLRKEGQDGQLEDLDEFLEKEEEAIAQANEDEFAAEEEKNLKIKEAKEQAVRDEIKIAQKSSNALFGILNGSLRNEEARINSSYKKQQNALQRKFDNGIISQEDFNSQSKALEKQKAREEYEIELEKFKNRKAQALVNIAIDIASAVAKVWGETGIAAIALQAIPIAAGVIQTGIVLGQEAPAPPQFREGGDVKSWIVGGSSHEAGGTTYTGEDGNRIELERGEGLFATKKGSSTEAALAHINQEHGGRGLTGVSRYYANGGSVVTSGSDLELVRLVMKETLESVNIVTQLEDIQTGLDDRQEVLNAGVISN